MNNGNLFEPLKTDFYKIKKDNSSIISFNKMFNSYIKPKSILIFEPFDYHHECSPGFTKYFIDIGYNVDLLMCFSGLYSFSLFKHTEKIRFIIFNNLKQINNNAQNLGEFIKKYEYVLIQTIKEPNFKLYNKIGFFNLNSSIFIQHKSDIFNKTIFINFFKNNRIWSIGNNTKALFVNPHYFGNIKIKPKNNKTRFFLTSTDQRNYALLLESSQRLKNENFEFELIVTGRSKRLNSKTIPKNLSDIFIFMIHTPYNELYKAIENSDYIIIPLDPRNDEIYKKDVVSGSFQLVYGFIKPALVHQEFACFQHLDNQNSLIYNNNNFYNIMKKAILLKNKEYENLQENIRILEKEIYLESIKNIRKSINAL